MASGGKLFLAVREKLKWLDPFTYVDLYLMPRINPQNNEALSTAVYIVCAFVFAYILYNFVLAFLLGTSTPLVIVYSGSMEPYLYRGDVVILYAAREINVRTIDLNFSVREKYVREFADVGYDVSSGKMVAKALKINGREIIFDNSGPTIVYHSQIRANDIIHRAVLKLRASDGEYLITYGDSNPTFDQDCQVGSTQCINLYAVPVSDLKGKEMLHIPLLGYVKLLIFDDLPRLLAGKPSAQ